MRSPASGALRSRAFGFLHFDRANPGLDRANRIMSVANDALAAVRKGRSEFEARNVSNSTSTPCNQPTSGRFAEFGERIIDIVFLSERDDAILVHGVTLLLGDSGGLVTNPVRRLLHPVTQFPT